MKQVGIILLLSSTLAGPGATRAARQGADPPDSPRARAVHLLNRITYGPRPGDVDRVLERGIPAFLDDQLTADRRPDPALEEILAVFPVTTTTTAELGRLVATIQRDRRAAQLMGPDSSLPGPRARAPSDAQRTLRRHLVDYRQLTLLRAVHANAQLYEITVDFWTNHFNVFSEKGPVRYLVRDHIEEVIRPHAFGRFADLLVATARSPAMLAYLDNAGSVAPGSVPPDLVRARERIARASRLMDRPGGPGARGADRVRQAQARLDRVESRLPTGINENYARELLELHTMGVDAGYTQADVEAVARIFTGWSFEGPPRGDYRFRFNAWAHDPGAKTVLGVTYPEGGGQEEGLDLLRRLAAHPATMTHVSGKLCERFVSEPATDACIEAGVRAWLASDGEIREVLRGILTSDAFWAPDSYRSKIKTPIEFLVSAVRSLGAQPDSAAALVAMARRLGQPLFGAEPPTGYPETSEEWVNAGALLNRLNLGLAIAGASRADGPRLDSIIPLSGDVDDMVAAANRNLLGGQASDHTLRVLADRAREVALPGQRRRLIVGLALGSPEFQRQ